MSFYKLARRVRDASLPLYARHGAFKGCLAHHAGATRCGYRDTFRRIASAAGFSPDQQPNVDQLMAATALLEAEYYQFQHRLRIFAQGRIRAKCQGRRRPSPGELQNLRNGWQITSPDANVQNS